MEHWAVKHHSWPGLDPSLNSVCVKYLCALSHIISHNQDVPLQTVTCTSCALQFSKKLQFCLCYLLRISCHQLAVENPHTESSIVMPRTGRDLPFALSVQLLWRLFSQFTALLASSSEGKSYTFLIMPKRTAHRSRLSDFSMRIQQHSTPTLAPAIRLNSKHLRTKTSLLRQHSYRI